jgi:hypothetical protein
MVQRCSFLYGIALLPMVSQAFIANLPSLAIANLQNTRLFVTNNPTVNVAGKYFQIEEMEDRDRSTTEVYLNPDSTVSFLKTDGPLHKSASGSWKFLPNGMFEITLERVFDAGQPTKEPTKLGAFQFATKRVLRGTMAHVGAKISMEGTIIDVSVGEERSLGFFEMIDSRTESMDDWQPKGRSAFSR